MDTKFLPPHPECPVRKHGDEGVYPHTKNWCGGPLTMPHPEGWGGLLKSNGKSFNKI